MWAGWMTWSITCLSQDDQPSRPRSLPFRRTKPIIARRLLRWPCFGSRAMRISKHSWRNSMLRRKLSMMQWTCFLAWRTRLQVSFRWSRSRNLSLGSRRKHGIAWSRDPWFLLWWTWQLPRTSPTKAWYRKSSITWVSSAMKWSTTWTNWQFRNPRTRLISKRELSNWKLSTESSRGRSMLPRLIWMPQKTKSIHRPCSGTNENRTDALVSHSWNSRMRLTQLRHKSTPTWRTNTSSNLLLGKLLYH